MFDFECIGNLHIHSVHSDGKGTVEQIAESAAKVGLDFIIITDHSYMTDALYLNEEGYYGKVLVLVGGELGVRFHHYLAFDLKERIAEHDLPTQKVIDEVEAQGGFGFLPTWKRPSPHYVTHRVRTGETLSGIARRYGTSVEAIIRANGLRSANRIMPGQRLRIPTRGARLGDDSQVSTGSPPKGQ